MQATPSSSPGEGRASGGEARPSHREARGAESEPVHRDLATLAQAYGLLGQVYRSTPASASTVHARMEWSTGAAHPLWTVFVQLNFPLSAATMEDPAAFRRAVALVPRPRAPADVPTWLASVGATSAEWRLEIEVREPCTPPTISQALFLHHLLRQTVAPASACPCLPRPGGGGAGTAAACRRSQFVALFRQHLLTVHTPLEAHVHTVLHGFCVDHQLACHPVTGYPVQPRPHDLTPRDLGHLNGCAVTPKADGLEAFFVGHHCGFAVVTRGGLVRCERWADGTAPLTPLILEGEVVQGTFVAYDCLATPVMAYISHGRFETRQAAMRQAVRRLGLDRVIHKPYFPVEPHPQRALRRCVEWAERAGVPCDGVVFVDAELSGYAAGPRLWKLKHLPTIDFAVYGAPAPCRLYEVMLRGGPASAMQSLHRFRDAQFEYDLPVLLEPPASVTLADGDVVELGLRVDRDWESGTGTVTFPTMQVRERGKHANFLVGGMDLVANGMTLATLLQPGCSVLPRLVLDGPVRRARTQFLQGVLAQTGATRVLEVGGGCGGDLAVWMRHPRLAVVDVVEPDATAVAEYRRRLVETHGATPSGDNGLCAAGRLFRFHTARFQDVGGWLSDDDAGVLLAVLIFSITQVAAEDADTDQLLSTLADAFGVAAVAVAAHDHVAPGGLPDGTDGVRCTVERGTDCPDHPLVCPCGGVAAQLCTRVLGSTMADGIRESAFSADHTCRLVERHGRFRVAQRLGPVAGGGGLHWLLDSMVFMLWETNGAAGAKRK